MTGSPLSLFGIMEMERDPPRFGDVLDQAQTYLIDVGGFAALGLAVWIITVLTRAPAPTPGVKREPLISRWMWLFGAGALAVYTLGLVLTVLGIMNAPPTQYVTGPDGSQVALPRPPTQLERSRDLALAVAGFFAILGFAQPFVRDLFRVSGRRVWALAKLSFKEALSRKVVFGFAAFLLIFLFPANWFQPPKPEDELRTLISVIFDSLTLLMIVIALLLAAFSIPSDVKNQTIHTIVTKPVERLEIVLGRFLGFLGLMTIALVVLCTLSLVFIHASNVDPLAAQESMKARNPVYGLLEYRSRKADFTGVDVGRERGYRKYIAGGELSSHRAVWHFVDVPSGLADLDAVPVEFAFDIYRTTKGEENRGVYASFNVVTWKWSPARQQEYEAAIRQAFGTYPKNVRPPREGEGGEAAEQWARIGQIAEEFGRYEWRNYEVYDYHIGTIYVPPGLFKNAASGNLPEGGGFPTPRGPARLQVQVKCESPSQFLGVANWDLYLLKSEGSFTWNFLKAAVGLWARVCIVIMLAVACSTYLAGVISFLVALFLFVAGAFQDFIQSLAVGTNVGGGPMEALTRLVRGDLTTTQLDPTPTVQVAQVFDEAFRWLMRRFLNVIPDTERYGWSDHVAEGFSVQPEFMLVNLISLVAYLLPWAVLAYYLMKSREVAA